MVRHVLATSTRLPIDWLSRASAMDHLTVRINGSYIGLSGRQTTGHGSGYSSSNWEQICADHEMEFPCIRQCFPGTLNVELPEIYEPPEQERYKRMAKERGANQQPPWYINGNHVSPRAKVIEINGKAFEAWIYCGGHHRKPVLELISKSKIAQELSLKDHDQVMLLVAEVAEGSCGMPAPPLCFPGKILSRKPSISE